MFVVFERRLFSAMLFFFCILAITHLTTDVGDSILSDKDLVSTLNKNLRKNNDKKVLQLVCRIAPPIIHH